jgi:hypothetical protein
MVWETLNGGEKLELRRHMRPLHLYQSREMHGLEKKVEKDSCQYG